MAQFLIRKVREDVAREVKKRAAKSGRSAEAELRAWLEDSYKPASENFWTQAAKSIEEQRRKGLMFDSTTIIRKSRDSGWSS